MSAGWADVTGAVGSVTEITTFGKFSLSHESLSLYQRRCHLKSDKIFCLIIYSRLILPVHVPYRIVLATSPTSRRSVSGYEDLSKDSVPPEVLEAAPRHGLEYFGHVGVDCVFVAGPNMACRLREAQAVLQRFTSAPRQVMPMQQGDPDPESLSGNVRPWLEDGEIHVLDGKTAPSAGPLAQAAVNHAGLSSVAAFPAPDPALYSSGGVAA